MQVQASPLEVSRTAGAAANLGRRAEAVEATVNERVALVRHWCRARGTGLSSQERAAAVGVSRASPYRWRRYPQARPSASPPRPPRQWPDPHLGCHRRPNPRPLGRYRTRPAPAVLLRRCPQATTATDKAGQEATRSSQGQQTGGRRTGRHPLGQVLEQPDNQTVHRRRSHL